MNDNLLGLVSKRIEAAQALLPLVGLRKLDRIRCGKIEREIQLLRMLYNWLERGLTHDVLERHLRDSNALLLRITATLAYNRIDLRTKEGKQAARYAGYYAQRERYANLLFFKSVIG